MRKLILAVAIAISPVYAGETKSPDVEVLVIVGGSAIPLSARHNFVDVAGQLPKPGQFSVTDEHARKHQARIYCYRFPGEEENVILKLHDSSFGMHTAELERMSAEAGKQCTAIDAKPEFKVGAAMLSLSEAVLPDLPEFQKRKNNNSVRLKREWTYSDPSKTHQWGHCFARLVSIEAVTAERELERIEVTNWEEPGC